MGSISPKWDERIWKGVRSETNECSWSWNIKLFLELIVNWVIYLMTYYLTTNLILLVVYPE